MRAIVLIMMLALVSACGQKEKPPAENATTQKNDTNEKVEFIKDISGVWTDGDALISIVYHDNKFQIWVGDYSLNARLGDIDTVNETLNILVKQNDGDEVISTLRRKWNADKTGYNLTFTGYEGHSFDLSFVRKISNDDLNRLSKLSGQFPKFVRPENNESSEVESKPTYESSEPISEIPSTDVAKLASQYFFVSSDATSVDGISGFYANQVNYYGKGAMSSAAVMADKSQYIRRWTIRKYEQLGKISVADGGVPGQKVATYKYRFYLANSKQEIVGTAVQDLTMQMIGGKLLIVGENGKTLTSKKTNLETPAPSQQSVPEASKAY